MNKIAILSPYSKQYAYPSFWRLLELISQSSELYNPIEENKSTIIKKIYKTKLKHLMPALSLLKKIILNKYRPDVILIFGNYLLPIIFLLKIFTKNTKYITYQPELFEFNSKLFTLIFKLSIERYDLFIDVDHTRLKLRRRYFKNLPFSIVLLNFNHSIKEKTNENYKKKYLYAGVIENEADLSNFIKEKSIDINDIDIYATKVIKRSKNLNFKYLNPRPFDDIANLGYKYGIICYEFSSKNRRDLNNKYCAPSKFFSYLSFGIVPIHKKHPTLGRYSKMGLSIDADVPEDYKFNNFHYAKIELLFDNLNLEIKSAQSVILNMACIKPLNF
jgi:hypothetical protein